MLIFGQPAEDGRPKELGSSKWLKWLLGRRLRTIPHTPSLHGYYTGLRCSFAREAGILCWCMSPEKLVWYLMLMYVENSLFFEWTWRICDFVSICSLHVRVQRRQHLKQLVKTPCFTLQISGAFCQNSSVWAQSVRVRIQLRIHLGVVRRNSAARGGTQDLEKRLFISWAECQRHCAGDRLLMRR